GSVSRYRRVSDRGCLHSFGEGRMRQWIMVAIAGGLLACGVEARRALAPEDRTGSAPTLMRMSAQASAQGGGRGIEEAAFSFAAPVTQGTPAMILRTGSAQIRVDSLEPAISAVRGLAGRVGGYVANTTQQGGDGQLRSAMLEMKVPAARFNDALRGLQPIGKVEAVNVTAEDVGEEYVDVTARVANARRLEQRLLDLLATRAGKLHDVIELEQELARVREEIERHEGRLRYLRAHAAVSRLAVTVHERVPVVGVAGSPLSEAA